MIRPDFKPFGDAALLVEFGNAIDPDLNALVMALDRAMADQPVAGVIETAPSFRSLMVQFDPLETDAAKVEGAVSALLPDLKPEAEAGRLWSVPACYEGEFAPDLGDVAEQTGLAPGEIVALHSSIDHVVFMIGFLPGCPYLGGVPDILDLPRRTDPRLKVPKGSIGLAIGLSNIYPVESPGGWHLIGRTPVELFDPGGAEPALLAPGDRVRFRPVSEGDYLALSDAVARGEAIAEVIG